MSAEDWAAIRPNLKTVAEAAYWWEILHGHVEQAAPAEDRDFLAAAADAAEAIDWSDSPWPQLIARLKETSGRTGKALFHPLRLALTGRDSGPEMAVLLPLIGRDETVAAVARGGGLNGPAIYHLAPANVMMYHLASWMRGGCHVQWRFLRTEKGEPYRVRLGRPRSRRSARRGDPDQGAGVIIPAVFPPTEVDWIPFPQAPPPEPAGRAAGRPGPHAGDADAAPDPIVPLPPRGDTGIRTGPIDPGPIRIIPEPLPPRQPDPAPPVRIEAQLDPRFASALQPQYPASEQRAQNSGTVRIRVTIGTDGRVRAVERVSATSDAFFAAAERQALSRWRFRPATVDGRPVESVKVMTVHFRIEEV